MELAKEEGPYSTFEGSPISGSFSTICGEMKDEDLSGRWDWASLRKEVMEHGVRNSLLVAPMLQQHLKF
jgi:ribonucleoside-diphosphate reductase alpha chain